MLVGVDELKGRENFFNNIPESKTEVESKRETCERDRIVFPCPSPVPPSTRPRRVLGQLAMAATPAEFLPAQIFPAYQPPPGRLYHGRSSLRPLSPAAHATHPRRSSPQVVQIKGEH